jgi:hypothetical protein
MSSPTLALLVLASDPAPPGGSLRRRKPIPRVVEVSNPPSSLLLGKDDDLRDVLEAQGWERTSVLKVKVHDGSWFDGSPLIPQLLNSLAHHIAFADEVEHQLISERKRADAALGVMGNTAILSQRKRMEAEDNLCGVQAQLGDALDVLELQRNDKVKGIHREDAAEKESRLLTLENRRLAAELAAQARVLEAVRRENMSLKATTRAAQRIMEVGDDEVTSYIRRSSHLEKELSRLQRERKCMLEELERLRVLSARQQKVEAGYRKVLWGQRLNPDASIRALMKAQRRSSPSSLVLPLPTTSNSLGSSAIISRRAGSFRKTV